jgi:hypothetical protein
MHESESVFHVVAQPGDELESLFKLIESSTFGPRLLTVKVLCKNRLLI